LQYSFTIPVVLGVLMGMGAEAEAMMSSVERIKFYTEEIPQEEDISAGADGTSVVQVPLNWPSEGRIEATNVQMRYRDGPLILKGVSFSIRGSETIGIAGRTGSGKSSLLVALFRMEPLHDGVILIDGVDISKIPLKILRSRLSIIPQDPVMFIGTVRFNLDPFDEYTDEQLWSTLEVVGLKSTVQDLPSQLLAEVVEGGDNLSVGQRQVHQYYLLLHNIAAEFNCCSTYC
jgi:ABC-type multidrug transport system fused ATPase/permease subunit